VLLHEWGGHFLAAKLLEVPVDRVEMTCFGGGRIFYGACSHIPFIGRLALDLSGMAVNLASALLAFGWLSRKRPECPDRLLGLLVFAGVGWLSQTAYLVMGGYYAYGDPVSLVEAVGSPSFVWGGGLLLWGWGVWYWVSGYLRFFQQRYDHRPTYEGRLRRFMIAWVPALLVYAGFFYLERGPLASVDAKAVSEERVREEAAAIHRREPDRTVEEIEREIRPFPIEIVLLGVGGVAGLWAFSDRRFSDSDLQVPLPLRAGRTALAAAGAVVVLWMLK
jgi:hypothetical protein